MISCQSQLVRSLEPQLASSDNKDPQILGLAQMISLWQQSNMWTKGIRTGSRAVLKAARDAEFSHDWDRACDLYELVRNITAERRVWARWGVYGLVIPADAARGFYQ